MTPGICIGLLVIVKLMRLQLTLPNLTLIITEYSIICIAKIEIKWDDINL